jgi:predicted RNA binding protein YcfA (HicA-like mRNA interferase family)
MEANLILHSKDVIKDGSLIEIKIWLVPKSKYRPFGLKYSLVYIEKNLRIIGYDNSEQKGDHKHYKELESKYNFVSIESLIEDFKNDVLRHKNESKKH